MNREAFAVLGQPGMSAIGCLPYMEKWFSRVKPHRSWFHGNMSQRTVEALGDWHPDDTAVRARVLLTEVECASRNLDT